VTTLAVVATAGAAPLNVDVQLDIAVGQTVSGPWQTIPTGGSTSVTGLRFAAGPEANLVTPQPASVRVRFTLPPGLSWGTDLPDITESCASTDSVGECQTPELQPSSGQSGYGWVWDIVAAQPGSYILRAEIIGSSTADPVTSNNASSITVVVTPSGPTPSPEPEPEPPSAGKVRLSPAKPKAGAAVAATVRVLAGGSPIRPTAVSCSGSIAGTKLKGSPKASRGTASCTFRPPRTAKGKSLRGSVSFTARGTRFTKRFSAKLG
jgi:hypothetical protein